MKKDLTIFLLHIFESIEKIEKYTAGITKENFKWDEKTQDAVIKRFEIMGEATKNIPTEFKKKHPQINWKKLADTRNFFIHVYYGIDSHRLWKTIKEENSILKDKISKILEIESRNKKLI